MATVGKNILDKIPTLEFDETDGVFKITQGG